MLFCRKIELHPIKATPTLFPNLKNGLTFITPFATKLSLAAEGRIREMECFQTESAYCSGDECYTSPSYSPVNGHPESVSETAVKEVDVAIIGTFVVVAGTIDTPACSGEYG